MVEVYGALLFGSFACQSAGSNFALGDDVDVAGQCQGDDVGVQAVDHRARLLAGPAVRLLDRRRPCPCFACQCLVNALLKST